MTPPPAASAAGTRRLSGHTIPRRTSGPARPRAVPAGAGAARPAVALPGLAGVLVRRGGALVDSSPISRLVTGRAWIALVATALLGLVFFQVSLLKLNAGIGRGVERSTALERENAGLRASVSRLGSADRIQTTAQQMGMILPASNELRFLTVGGRRLDDAQAAALPPVAAASSTATLPSPVTSTTSGATTPASTAATATASSPAAHAAVAPAATPTPAPTPVVRATPVPTPTPVAAAPVAARPAVQATAGGASAPAGG